MKKLGTAIILVLLVAIIAGGVVFSIRQASAPTCPIEIMLPPPCLEIKVYVSGEVQNPGIHVLNAGARVSDAIEAAEGFTPEADHDAINPARRLRDGAQVHVRKIGEIPQRININTADAWLLDALPGIGDVLAARIIEHRTEQGPFQSIEQLREVRGIRPETLDRLRDKITVICLVGVLAMPPCHEIHEITVYVSGEVQNPGIHVLNVGARVSDAIEAAGGFTLQADRYAINPARRLRDGDQVHVRKIGEAPQRININTADAWLLDALPGIGDILAARIIEHRTEHGPFQSIKQLKEVRGIRPETFDGLKDKITVH